MKPSGFHQARSPRTVAGTGLVVCALVASVSLSGSAVSWAATPTTAAVLLPDLVADPPGASAPPQVYTDPSGTTSLLLRFDGYVHNQGAGAVDVRADTPVGTGMSVVRQRIYDDTGSYVDAMSPAVVRYETADGHNHWHLMRAAAYSLWNEARTAQISSALKVGFCFVDSAHVDPFGPATPAYTTATNAFCERANPAASSVFMGVSAGWRDVYSKFLSFQWVDISDVAPGRYWLRSAIDPDNVLTESNEVNASPFAASSSTVNGYNATSFSRRVGTLFPSSVPLSATVFDDPHPGSPGTRQFRIDQAPSNGTLNQSVGVWFNASSVTYSPRFLFSGQDSFRFSARDSASQFPLHPVSATASIGVGVNPATAAAARQFDLTPARTAAAPDVTTAPPSAAGNALGEPVVSTVGPWVLVSAVAGRGGLVRMSAVAAGVPIGRCETRAPVGATVTCRFDNPAGADPHVQHHGAAVTRTAPVLAEVTLSEPNGSSATRTAAG
jgi:hypothetical protein